MRFDRKQLLIYAVTDKAWTGKLSLEEQVEEALKGGATMVQLREKELDKGNFEEVLRTACAIRKITEKYNVPLIIDDNLELALACHADGLHVGQDDMEASEARRLLGPDRILGVTAKTVDQPEQPRQQARIIWQRSHIRHQYKSRCAVHDNGDPECNLRQCGHSCGGHRRNLPG